MRHILNVLVAALILLYPLAVYYSIAYWSARSIGLLLLIVLLLRLILASSSKRPRMVVLWMGVLFCTVVIWNNDVMTLRFYPVLVSLSLLALFAGSLLFPPPLVERLARLQHPDLPPEGVLYTRKVTWMWSIFFLFNASIACYTAIYSSFELWSLYNGLISYILMGVLMAVEYGIRYLTQKHVR